ncbi:MAG: hypothetical protein C3F13_02755 [Anaerolineales bacterium]|nr:MAG: hypothetical protein C3F13_02755 [Anaerolineales bacterium]
MKKIKKASEENPISPGGQLRELVFVSLLIVESIFIVWAFATFKIDLVVKLVLYALELLLFLLIMVKIIDALTRVVKSSKDFAESIYNLIYQLRGRITGSIRVGTLSIKMPTSNKVTSIDYQIDEQAQIDIVSIFKLLDEIKSPDNPLPNHEHTN